MSWRSQTLKGKLLFMKICTTSVVSCMDEIQTERAARCNIHWPLTSFNLRDGGRASERARCLSKSEPRQVQNNNYFRTGVPPSDRPSVRPSESPSPTDGRSTRRSLSFCVWGEKSTKTETGKHKVDFHFIELFSVISRVKADR